MAKIIVVFVKKKLIIVQDERRKKEETERFYEASELVRGKMSEKGRCTKHVYIP